MKHRIETMYLAYYNEYLRVSTFALAFDLTEARARRVIRIGKRLNQRHYN